MRRTLIANNADFVNVAATLRDLAGGPEFSKMGFVVAGAMHNVRCPKSFFENLRTMKMVTLVRVEDLSTIMDEHGDEQEISVEQYNALPECVRVALGWTVCPKVRNWYKVNYEAVQWELDMRKMEVMRDYELLNSL